MRSSIISAVAAGNRANLTMEGCSIGGIGEAARTEYADRWETLRMEGKAAGCRVLLIFLGCRVLLIFLGKASKAGCSR